MSENQDKAWIQTFTNRKFHILRPTEDEVDILDIAHALSNLCRFTGHVVDFYSVAEHCYFASKIVAPEFAMEALLHDASEAYISDLNRPLKHYTEAGRYYLEVEKNIEEVIARKFRIPHPMSPKVKDVDNMMLYAEKAQIMPPMEWDTRWSETQEAATVQLRCYAPREIERIFLERFTAIRCGKI